MLLIEFLADIVITYTRILWSKVSFSTFRMSIYSPEKNFYFFWNLYFLWRRSILVPKSFVILPFVLFLVRSLQKGTKNQYISCFLENRGRRLYTCTSKISVYITEIMVKFFKKDPLYCACALPFSKSNRNVLTDVTNRKHLKNWKEILWYFWHRSQIAKHPKELTGELQSGRLVSRRIFWDLFAIS